MGQDTHDQNYLALHRREFVSMGHKLIMADDTAAPRRDDIEEVK